MPITPDRLSRLREFGLSEYAARAYLALLDLGVAEARDVSTLSKVPQAKIYHVLEQLHDKGLATILPEFPKKYAPVAFSDYLNRIHEEHERAAQAIDRDREVLEDMFRVVGDTEVGNRGFFTVVRGRRNVVQKIQEMVQEAKEDMLVLATSGFALRYTHFKPDLDAAAARGVRLRVLAPLTPETTSKLSGLEGVVEVRARALDEGSVTSRVAIVTIDHKRAFLINFLPDDDNVYTGKDIGVYTDQESMVRALESLIDAQWQGVGGLKERLGALFGLTRDAVLVLGEGGRVILQNPVATRLLGDVTGAPVEDVVAEHERVPEGGEPVLARVTAPGGGLLEVEAVAGSLDGPEGRTYRVLMLREQRGQPVDIRVEGDAAAPRRR